MRRLPARYWRFLVAVQRTQGSGGIGEILDPATTHLAMVFQETKTVRDDSGSETVSTNQIHLPAGVDPIPVGSVVTLPAIFGGGTTRVIAAKPRFWDGTARLAYFSLDCE